MKLAKFSLRKRITILKNEWWYWDEIIQSESTIDMIAKETVVEEDKSIILEDSQRDTEEILQLFNTNPDELV